MPPESIPPLTGLKIRLSSSVQGTRALRLSDGKDLSMKAEGDTRVVALDRLDIYEVIVIE